MTEKSTWGKEAGAVEMGRDKRIRQKDSPGHSASRSVQKSAGDRDTGRQITRAGQWKNLRTDA